MMSGIAGWVDLTGARPIRATTLRMMTRALAHRGPNGEAFHEEPGVALGCRAHLVSPGDSGYLVGSNADQTVNVVCQSQLYNRDTLRVTLEGRGHSLKGHRDAELIAHLWDEYGEQLFERLRGQFAVALWDRRRRRLILARDRVGIAPLHWARRGDRVLFASEIKALFASGFVRPEVDCYGVDHAVTFLGLPASRTCFREVQALLPGHYLTVSPEQGEAVGHVCYWDLDFPNRGDELSGCDGARLTEELEALLATAVTRRLVAAGPVASYISGGLDCSTAAALARRQRPDLPTFTVRIDSPDHDESERAVRASQALGEAPTILTCRAADMMAAYPDLIRAAESPVADPSCAALMLLAERVRAAGYRVALAGDGADDIFAGYPWFKVDRILGLLDWFPGVRLSQTVRRLFLRVTAPQVSWSLVRRIQSHLGGHHAWLDLYGLFGMCRSRFYSAGMKEALAGRVAYEDLTLNLSRMRRWHPLNQDLYLSMKLHVPGLLLRAKGDRIASRSGLELRYPFLDEDVVAFAAGLHPDWKLRRLTDKFLLRRVAARYLPADIAWRPKVDFVAPFESLYGQGASPLVEQLLSDESLRRGGYFDPGAVRHWRQRYPQVRPRSTTRISVEIGLASVVATQFWHHMFIDGSLAEVPSAA
jgi:asparagine synthase (glutamine-hydrolysing)